MQIFVPYPNVVRSIMVLDDKRLRNQRNEALVQLKSLLGEYASGGWINHPSTQAYKHSLLFLSYYGALCALVCQCRGIKSKHGDPSPFMERAAKLEEDGHKFKTPAWWGDTRIHDSHKANLVRKDIYYRDLWPDVVPTNVYVWGEDTK